MELNKEIATKGDNFANKLLSNSPLQMQQVYDFFSDRNEAIFVCNFLRDKDHIKLLSPSDTEPFRVIEKKDSLSDFIDSGGFEKMFLDLEQKLTNQKEMEFLNKRLTELSITNLELQNRKLKREIWIAIIFFIVGAIVANVKDILIMLKTIMNQ